MKSVGVKIDRLTELFRPDIAFSLRNLGLKYSNEKIIEVRRDDNNDFERFSVEEINNGTLISFCNGSSGKVSWFKNQNGEYDAYMDISNKQPELVDQNGNLNQINNNPIIKRTAYNQLLKTDYKPNGENRILFFVGESNFNKGCLFGSNEERNFAILSDNFISPETSTNANVLNSKLNSNVFNYSGRIDLSNQLQQQGQFLLSLVANIYFTDDSFGFGYNKSSHLGYGMYSLQEFILFEKKVNINILEKIINNYYNVF